MKMKNSEKPFDCVEFKRRAQEQIYEKIKNMTPTEEIEFFRQAVESGPFADLIRQIPGNGRRVLQTMPNQAHSATGGNP
ncbi:MAG: hypothetical protein AABZ47_01705 [Planctomycetota bacterium]